MKREKNPVKIGLLTEREYGWLKDQQALSPEETAKIEEYEKIKPKHDLATTKSKRDKIKITKKLLWNHFLLWYRHISGNEFKQTDEAISNIAPIINYFAFEPDFFKNDALVRKIGNSALEPSFDKGLLIIGAYGNGKSSIMRTLAAMFDHFQMPMKFKTVNAHDVVTEYETINNPGEKDLFFERYKCKSLHIDDVKKEETASNYGKVEIIRAILEKRYDEGLKTYITCNYREGANNDIADGLVEFGERYGEHIYDRLFEMCNIIHFTGKSFRN